MLGFGFRHPVHPFFHSIARFSCSVFVLFLDVVSHHPGGDRGHDLALAAAEGVVAAAGGSGVDCKAAIGEIDRSSGGRGRAVAAAGLAIHVGGWEVDVGGWEDEVGGWEDEVGRWEGVN
jgi:hypothetical protein